MTELGKGLKLGDVGERLNGHFREWVRNDQSEEVVLKLNVKK